jgi:glycosyltransferase involved in cell wall biosynthesis
MRDAIVLSGWTWEANNVPERMAQALAHGGARVLYCEKPISVFKDSAKPLAEVEKNLFVLGLTFFAQRVNSFPAVRRFQSKFVLKQILRNAEILQLKDPLLVYPHGDFLPLIAEFKQRGFPLVNICMDYELSIMMEHVRLSDLTLVIPLAAYRDLKSEFGHKIKRIPQFASQPLKGITNGTSEVSELTQIGRPRLGYLGDLTGRVSYSLLSDILAMHPDWQFISFGSPDGRLGLPNAHILPWRPLQQLEVVLEHLDIGFMPYDGSPKNMRCVPLKLFDYFAHGLPVVATPIDYLREPEFDGLVYLGSTTEELTKAISLALSEPADSPKKEKRRAVTQNHSLDKLSPLLASILEKVGV